jgi:hypothetical protein
MNTTMTDAAQDAYENEMTEGEQRQLEALSRAEAMRKDFGADDLMLEFADCAEDVNAAMALHDAGTLSLLRLGQILLNIRNAALQRQCGVFAAPDAQVAISMAMRGEVV